MSAYALISLGIIVIILAYSLGVLLRQHSPAAPKTQTYISPLAGESPPPTDEREMEVVVRWLLSQAFEQTGVAVAGDKVAQQRIREAAHQALLRLQTQHHVTIRLPHLATGADGPRDFEAYLTRELLQELLNY